VRFFALQVHVRARLIDKVDAYPAGSVSDVPFGQDDAWRAISSEIRTRENSHNSAYAFDDFNGFGDRRLFTVTGWNGVQGRILFNMHPVFVSRRTIT
jgi:hypothetical protein